MEAWRLLLPKALLDRLVAMVTGYQANQRAHSPSERGHLPLELITTSFRARSFMMTSTPQASPYFCLGNFMLPLRKLG